MRQIHQNEIEEAVQIEADEAVQIEKQASVPEHVIRYMSGTPLPATAWPRQRRPASGKVWVHHPRPFLALMQVRSGMVGVEVSTGACESIHVRYASASDGLA